MTTYSIVQDEGIVGILMLEIVRIEDKNEEVQASVEDQLTSTESVLRSLVWRIPLSNIGPEPSPTQD